VVRERPKSLLNSTALIVVIPRQTAPFVIRKTRVAETIELIVLDQSETIVQSHLHVASSHRSLPSVYSSSTLFVKFKHPSWLKLLPLQSVISLRSSPKKKKKKSYKSGIQSLIRRA